MVYTLTLNNPIFLGSHIREPLQSVGRLAKFKMRRTIAFVFARIQYLGVLPGVAGPATPIYAPTPAPTPNSTPAPDTCPTPPPTPPTAPAPDTCSYSCSCSCSHSSSYSYSCSYSCSCSSYSYACKDLFDVLDADLGGQLHFNETLGLQRNC